MIDGLSVLAVIPARGGSKGLPGKNVKQFLGKPLLHWSIESAQASDCVDRIIVSTDSEEIAGVARSGGCEVLARPEHLAGDAALIADALRNLISELNSRGNHFDLMVLLQPTSPIRPVRLIDRCVREMLRGGANSLATFSKLPVEAERLWVLTDDEPRALLDSANPWLPRQALSEVAYLNGLVYVFEVDAFMASDQPSVLVGKSRSLLTEDYADIDTLQDFKKAETRMAKLGLTAEFSFSK
ncbi:MAG: cytidylyltransferase domain-containing protein [Pseudomonadales bacterium]